MTIASQGAFARTVSISSARHAVGPQASQRAAQRYKSGFTNLRGHRIVGLLSGVLFGFYDDRVVSRSLLSNCPCGPTRGRQLVLRDVLLGFRLGSKRTRTVRLDSVLGEGVRVWSGPRCIGAHFLSSLLDVAVELALILFKFDLSVRVALLQRVAVGRFSSTRGMHEQVQHVVSGPLFESTYHHSIGGLVTMSMCHSKVALS